jgi:hypothetical protein
MLLSPKKPNPADFVILTIHHDALTDRGASGEGKKQEKGKLAKYAGRVAWSYLAPHFLKGSLYFVDPAREWRMESECSLGSFPA